MIALLGLAFGMGLLATMNPCGFALLPTYLAYSATGASGGATSSLSSRLAHGLRAGLALSLGFAGVLTIAALIVALGARSIVSALPWVSLLVGIAMLVMGILMLVGRKLPFRIPIRAIGPRSGHAGPTMRVRDSLLFGIGYAIASLSCSFGLLIALISQAITIASFAGVLAIFGAFALGATTLLLGLSILAAAASGVVTAVLKRFAKLWAILPQLTGVILLLAGVYLVMYWLPAVTGQGADNPFVNAVSQFAGVATTWLSENQLTVIGSAIVVTAAAVGIVLLSRTRSNSGNEAAEASLPEADEVPEPNVEELRH